MVASWVLADRNYNLVQVPNAEWLGLHHDVQRRYISNKIIFFSLGVILVDIFRNHMQKVKAEVLQVLDSGLKRKIR